MQWKASDKESTFGGYSIRNEQGQRVGGAFEQKDAKLMAAAPELLEAAQFLIRSCYSKGITLPAMAEESLKIAINKAVGNSVE